MSVRREPEELGDWGVGTGEKEEVGDIMQREFLGPSIIANKDRNGIEMKKSA